ncbi:MAG TPA: protein arginine kinase [Candidatus Omnitrophica bacterium]|nr:MAG: protein arginine kinase [Candidatus Omnitrophota bacterium]RKY34562.1 MAG: protein arginine kinase [Candidatus Omnitrophota bacterium]RKY44519.1 MAG: protein arginine kinase [Candidatus Omnitrophota bacterium]HEC69435.1 protein arginine kinase [Candidatus Omnitrophota bacterium]
MILEDLLNKPGEWFKGKGPDANIIISSRIRLARNLVDIPFPKRMKPPQVEKLFERIRQAQEKSNFLRGFEFLKGTEISPLDREFLLERHLVSQEYVNYSQDKALLLRRDEVCSIMVNEEDHLRIQVIKSGFDLQDTWEIANRVEEEFSKTLNFAFSLNLGFLTSCPTNVGTGMRASCMLHLPGLIMTKRINRVLELISKLSFTTRGFFGEGTQAIGNFFQVSNQLTLGLSETEILSNLSGIIKQLKNQELQAREYMLSRYRLSLEDKICRALGVLKNCRLISSSETLSHLSLLRLGIDLGIIKNLDTELLNYLFIMIQPAHLQKIYKKSLSHQERDSIRAELLREKLERVYIR